jgi:WD40 repeat protein
MSAAAKACWSEIVENLNKGPDTDAVPLDANFCIAFELALDLDPLDDASKRVVFEKLDRSKDGTVSRLEFLSYHRGWAKAGGAASPAVAATEALPVASVAAAPVTAEAPLPVGLQGAVQGGEAVSDNLGAAAKSAEDAATGLSADSESASGKSRATMDLSGVRFELKLIFPIEMIFRLLLNQLARSIATGADLANALKVETKRLQEGINALRVAKLMAAHDALVELLACVQTALGLSTAEKEKAMSKISSDCRHVVELSTEAYRTVKSNHEKTLAVRTACSAIVLRLFEEPPKLVYAALTDQVKKLVSEKFVTNAIKTQLAGGSVLSSASKRIAILHPVLDICHDLYVFAYKYGLPEPALGGEPGLIVSDKGGVAFSALAESTKHSWRGDHVLLEGHDEPIGNICVTPDGTRALTGGLDKTAKIWDLASGACIHTLEGHLRNTVYVCVTPDSTHAVTACNDGYAKVWNLASGLCVHTLKGHQRGVPSVCVTPDGTRALTASYDGTAKVWDLASGRCFRTLVGHTDHVYDICVTPDGTRALTWSADNTAKVWDLASGACIHTLPNHKLPKGHPRGFSFVCVTPESTSALTASYDGTVKVWDLASGRCVRTLKCHEEPIDKMCFTPDGTHALTASRDTTAKIWDLASGACIHTLEGHKRDVPFICVAPDGRRALTVSEDNTAKVWDLASGACVRTLVGDIGWHLTSGAGRLTPDGIGILPLGVACVTPDGMRALAASSDGTVKVWYLY